MSDKDLRIETITETNIDDELLGVIDKITKKRYANGILSEEEDSIVIETRANLIINGKFYISIMCLPRYFEEMAIGFIFSEGLIESVDEIKKISHTCTGNIFIFTYKPVDMQRSEKRVLITGCANGSVNISFLDEENHRPLREDTRIDAAFIVKRMSQFSKQSKVFVETGAVHSAALVFKDGEGVFFEDIGRHNAVDKVIGTALKQNLDINSGILFISGRISSEIAIKAARLGISILVSQAAPTSISVAVAEKVGMTLVGFARGQRFNVYTGSHRILT